MRNIEEEKLDEITGGAVDSITGPIINATVGLIQLLKDAGYSFGTGIRRIIDEKLCPLE